MLIRMLVTLSLIVSAALRLLKVCKWKGVRYMYIYNTMYTYMYMYYGKGP